MDLQKLTFPVVIGAAVIGIWVAFRGANQGVTGAVTPNPASSGVPLPYSAGGVVQPINYDVAPVQLAPNPIIVLGQPNNPNPGAPNGGRPLSQSSKRKAPPPYLAFNFGPSHDLTKQRAPLKSKDESACGCGSCKSDCNSCDKKNAFNDGNGNTLLASSGRRWFAGSDPDTWLDSVLSNFSDYLQSSDGDLGNGLQFNQGENLVNGLQQQPQGGLLFVPQSGNGQTTN